MAGGINAAIERHPRATGARLKIVNDAIRSREQLEQQVTEISAASDLVAIGDAEANSVVVETSLAAAKTLADPKRAEAEILKQVRLTEKQRKSMPQGTGEMFGEFLTGPQGTGEDPVPARSAIIDLLRGARKPSRSTQRPDTDDDEPPP